MINGTKIIVGIATHPPRLACLLECIDRLIDQVDVIHVCLNEYTEVPEALQKLDKVICTIPETNLTDSGKFLHFDEEEGYYFSIDDDILVAPDYVKKTIIRMQDYPGAIVSYHGRCMRTDRKSKSYYRDCPGAFGFDHDVFCDIPVHGVGTGVTALHTRTLNLDISAWKRPRMSDIWFALEAQKQKVPMVVLAHDKGFLKENSRVQWDINSIFRTSLNNDSMQTELINSVKWPELKPLVKQKPQAKKQAFPVSNDTVGVVITSHNYGKFLEECIESVLNQSHRHIEIVVVDDASDSDDQTKQITESYGIKYLRVENENCHQSRYDGFLKTKADFVIFLDADDLLKPDYVAGGLAEFTSSEIGVVYSDRELFGTAKSFDRFMDKFDKDKFYSDQNCASCCSLIRREAILLCDAWDSVVYDRKALPEDYWMFQRIADDGWDFRKQKSSFLYRRHPGQWSDVKKEATTGFTYFHSHGIDKQNVTLFIPLSGREDCWRRMIRYLERQAWPHNQINLVLCDTSQDEEFSGYIRNWLNELDYDNKLYSNVHYYQLAVGSPGLADAERRNRPDVMFDVRHAMCKIYNSMRAKIDTQYTWILEDDIIPPDDTLERMLGSFDATVGSVSAPYLSRYGNSVVAWIDDGVPHKVARTMAPIPENLNQTQEIRGSGFGCVVVRSSLLKKNVIALPSSQDDFDPYFFRRMGNEWRRLLDWSLSCEHWEGDQCFRVTGTVKGKE